MTNKTAEFNRTVTCETSPHPEDSVRFELMTRRVYGRLTTRDGTQYLYDRAYEPFVLKRPRRAPQFCEPRWPSDVAADVCFGDERERTRRGPLIRDPWREEAGWYAGRWRDRAPRSKRELGRPAERDLADPEGRGQKFPHR